MKNQMLNDRILRIFFLGFSIIILSSCAQISFSSRPIYQTPSTDYHIVQKGETLYSISQKYFIPVEKLKLFNNLKTDRIFVGQKIYLYPRQKKRSDFVTVRSIPKEGFHIVKSKETIYRISKMYKVDILDIMDFNNLQSLDLKAGLKLWLIEHEGSTQEFVITEKTIPPKTEIEKEKIPKVDLFMPVNGVVTSEFGIRDGLPHKGVDFGCDMGEPIYATLAGKVVFAGTQHGYGNIVILEHDNLIMTVYAHNESNLVRLGETVIKGQPIATVGQTGNASAPHLHFEYRVKGKAINPRDVLPHF
ncbi:MAG: peptidoglycan DD-metalloendopeptidase family protein [Candidatus Cloacimonadales bacterium]|nr:peptidoglycan DD-metalloendopeptidase family protein [Candidatus Cloacimonadales bacterium]